MGIFDIYWRDIVDNSKNSSNTPKLPYIICRPDNENVNLDYSLLTGNYNKSEAAVNISPDRVNSSGKDTRALTTVLLNTYPQADVRKGISLWNAESDKGTSITSSNVALTLTDYQSPFEEEVAATKFGIKEKGRPADEYFSSNIGVIKSAISTTNSLNEGVSFNKNTNTFKIKGNKLFRKFSLDAVSPIIQDTYNSTEETWGKNGLKTWYSEDASNIANIEATGDYIEPVSYSASNDNFDVNISGLLLKFYNKTPYKDSRLELINENNKAYVSLLIRSDVSHKKPTDFTIPSELSSLELYTNNNVLIKEFSKDNFIKHIESSETSITGIYSNKYYIRLDISDLDDYYINAKLKIIVSGYDLVDTNGTLFKTNTATIEKGTNRFAFQNVEYIGFVDDYNNTKLNIGKLKKPTITKNIRTDVDKQYLEWSLDLKASSYKVKVGINDWITINNNYYEVSNLSVGIKEVQIQAIASDRNNHDSDIETVSFRMEPLEPLRLRKNESGIYSDTNPYIDLNWDNSIFISNTSVYYKLRLDNKTIYTTRNNIYRVYGDLLNNSDLGTHDWDIQVCYDKDSEYDSPWSDYLTYEIKQLENISGLHWDYSTYPDKVVADLYWREIAEADTYEILINNQHYLYKTSSPVSIREDIPGEYNIKVLALSNKYFYNRESNKENATALVYDVIRLEKVKNLTWNSSENKLSWEAPNNANSFDIYAYNDGSEAFIARVSDNYYIKDFGPYAYNIRVYANYIYKSEKIAATLNPRYLKSDFNGIYIGTLPEPNNLRITYSGNKAKLLWDTVKNIYNQDLSDGFDLILYIDNVKTGVYASNKKEFELNHSITPLSASQYKWAIKSYADIDTGSSIVRKYSNETTIDNWSYYIRQLVNTTANFITGKSNIYWSLTLNTDYYDVLVDDHIISTLSEPATEENPFKLSSYLDTNNEYSLEIGIKNRNNNEFLFIPNETILDTRYNIIRFKEPTLSYDNENSKISWTNNDSYSINYTYIVHIDGSYLNTDNERIPYHETFNTNNTYYYVSDLNPGNYSVWVEVKDANYNIENNPLYISNNEPDTKISFGTLPKPVLSIIANTITWEKISGADYYEIYDGNTLLKTTEETQYTLYSPVTRTFNIKVWAKSNSAYINDNNSYETVVISFYKLSTPVISKTGTAAITWNKVSSDSSVYYNIWINNMLKTNTKDNYINIAKYLNVGNNIVYIQAVSSNTRFIPSEFSNSISFKFRKPEIAIAIINNEAYDINLSTLGINKAIDTSLDTGVVTLRPNNLKDRFEKRTPIHIGIYPPESDVLDTSTEVLGYDFEISEDNVEEVYIGGEVKYKHKINLIELTKELQMVYLPNFSVTQKKEIVIQNAVNTVDASFNGKIFWETDYEDSTFKSNQKGIFGQWLPGNNPEYSAPYYSDIGTFNVIGNFIRVQKFGGRLNGEINDAYTLGSSMLLPNEEDNYFRYETFSYKAEQRSSASPTVYYTTLVDPTSETVEPFIYRYWYIRKHGENTETLIASSRDHSIKSWNIPSDYETGFYDIILRIPSITISIPYKTPWPDSQTKYYTREIKFMLKNNKFTDYEVVWENIRIATTLDTIEETRGISIYDAINKAVNIIKPLSVSESETETPKYLLWDKEGYNNEIYSNKLTELTKRECPKSEYTNLKSLYEVLLDLGRSFYGIPRLIYNENKIPTITFDVQGITNTGNLSFDETDVLVSRASSDIANSATSFISNVSNITSDNRFIQYPSGDIWITARSSQESDPVIKKATMSIQLPSNIYILKSLKVRNCIKANPNQEVDITAQTLESSVFQTLTNTSLGKGIALYYNQYDNKIMGLGILSPTTEWESTIGFESTDYVIEKIIAYKMGWLDSSGNYKTGTKNNLLDVNNYEYKIEYYSINDALVLNELENINNIKYQGSKPFNQDTSLVSDNNFGSSLNTQLKRLGNETITATYRILSYSKLPELGQKKVYNDEVYYADQVALAFNNNYVDATVRYSKNYTTINPRVGVNSDYRLYEIYSNNFITRDVSINNYCYLSLNKYNNIKEPVTMKNMRDAVRGAFKNSAGLTSKVYAPEAFYIKPLSSYNTQLKRLDYYGVLKEDKSVLLNADLKEFNNSLLFSAAMLDNYSAGKLSGNIQTTQQQYTQQDVPYTDEYGRCPMMSISLCTPKSKTLRFDALDPDYPTLPLSRTLPACKTVSPLLLENLLYTGTYLIDKDNREQLRFNYQLHFTTYDKNLTIHKNLANHIFLKLNGIQENVAKVYLYKGDMKDEFYFNTNDVNQFIDILVSQEDDYNNFRVRCLTTKVADNDYDGFVVVWPNSNEIIFNYETPIIKGESFTMPDIYFNFTPDKLEYREN